jgi:hypothetical protein
MELVTMLTKRIRYSEYYQDGMLHREDGPAVERINEYAAWYLYGNLHRVGGPAIAY